MRTQKQASKQASYSVQNAHLPTSYAGKTAVPIVCTQLSSFHLLSADKTSVLTKLPVTPLFSFLLPYYKSHVDGFTPNAILCDAAGQARLLIELNQPRSANTAPVVGNRYLTYVYY